MNSTSKINYYIDALVYAFSLVIVPTLIGLLSIALFAAVIYLFPGITLLACIGILVLAFIGNHLHFKKS